jgi:NitT/TauT family transport system ATP-binding protein
VYALMTMRSSDLHPETGSVRHIGYRLPDTDVTRIEGVLEMLMDAPFEGRADLPQLAEEAELPDEELFPVM